jgi:hypothetical protein
MKKSTDLPTTRRFALLLVGSPGSGKTTLGLQFPNVYVLDADDNLQGPTEYLKRTGLYKPYFYDSAYRDSEGKEVSPFQRYTHCVKCLTEAANSPEIDTIFLTSLTGFRDIVRDDILRQRPSNPSVKIGGNVPTPTEANRGMVGFVQQEWDTFAFYFRNLVTLMRSSGKNFILDAHFEKVQDEADKIFYETLAIPGQSRYNLAAMFTDTWQTFIETTGFGAAQKFERKVRTVPSSSTDLKGNKSSFDLPAVFSNEKDAAMKLILPQLEIKS